MNILIAEDNKIIQMLQRTLMENWGYSYDLASNGLEAVEYAKKNNGMYDLCLMDVEMPKMNGIEAAKIIRKTVDYFPIMGYTSNDDYKNACYEVGMDDFAVKPCLPDDLFAKINELSVKLYQLITKPNGFGIKEVMPVDSDELKELRELDKKGLTKFSLIGTGYKFTVHKNLQNKVSNDFIAKGKLLSEFLDCSEDEPGIIHLYASNLNANKKHILPELFEQMSQKEDEDLKNYTTKFEYPESEKE